MNIFSPDDGIESEWKEARSRLEAYLRALQVADQKQQEQIIRDVMQKAAAARALNPKESPTVLVMNQIRDLSEDWFESVLATRDRVSVTGFVSLFALDAPKNWPGVFLSHEVPAIFQRSLRDFAVRAAPDLKFSSMVPQPFDNALHDVMNLPSPLAELAKGRASLVTKLFAFLLSWLSIWSGNRFR